jgi:HK97 family phage major capsid protein
MALELELKQELEGIKTALETKTATEVKSAVDALEAKLPTAIKSTFDAEIKAVREELETKFKSDLKVVQDHADSLDLKLQEKGKLEANAKVDVLKSLIKENAENIVKVSKDNTIELKAVGDMTTGNFTGEEPRDYNFDIVTFPAQKVNVADLVGNINISGGTYTYTREGAGEGSIGAQTEGATKNQRDYDFTAVDVTTDFIAGFARYSKKMRNNLSYITSAIPQLLRRDYFKAENSAFNTILATDATASTEVITSSSKSKMLINEIGKLENANYDVNGIVVRPSDYLDILKTAKQDLESAVTYEGGVLRVAGVQVLKATWLAANKYFVGDWTRVNKITTEGLSLEFSETEGTNFVKNNITARIEAQVALAVEQPLALVYGDFTATA